LLREGRISKADLSNSTIQALVVASIANVIYSKYADALGISPLPKAFVPWYEHGTWYSSDIIDDEQIQHAFARTLLIVRVERFHS
jgi:hypothetical protein